MKIKLIRVKNDRHYWAQYRTEDGFFTVEQHKYNAPTAYACWFIYKTGDGPNAKYSGVEVESLADAREFLSEHYSHSALACFKTRRGVGA